MKTKLFLIMLLAASSAYAIPQQYVAAEPQPQVAQAPLPLGTQATPDNMGLAASPPPANAPIVINPQAGVAQVAAATPAAPSATQPSTMVAAAPPAASPGAAQPVTTIATVSAAPPPVMPAATQPSINVQQQSPALTEADKQTWFNNCLAGAKSKKAQMYAQEFCECGWRHISSGELPMNLLDTSDPNLIKDRDTRMKVISQECGAELMSRMQKQ